MQQTTSLAAVQSPSPRTLANRENAQKSTGPRTPEGEARSSRNAVRGALTGRVVLLPSDDLRTYEEHVRAYAKQFRPAPGYETNLVQTLADTAWRLARIPHLILALQTKGREDLADAFTHLRAAERAVRIELEIALLYEKQLRNLHLQEARLHRRHEKDVAELRRVQAERHAEQARELASAAQCYLAAQQDGVPFEPRHFGFEFSTHEIECYVQGQHARRLHHEKRFELPQKEKTKAAERPA